MTTKDQASLRKFREHLGAILRREREAIAGNTAQNKRDFASALGTDTRTIDRLERGDTITGLEEYAAKYAWLLGAPNDDPRPWWNEATEKWQAGRAPGRPELATAFANTFRDQSLRAQQRRRKEAQDSRADENKPSAGNRANR